MKVEQSSPSTRVVCIDTRNIKSLTIGKVYDANTSFYKDAYRILSDGGSMNDYHKDRFELLSVSRERKLLSLLEKD